MYTTPDLCQVYITWFAINIPLSVGTNTVLFLLYYLYLVRGKKINFSFSWIRTVRWKHGFCIHTRDSVIRSLVGVFHQRNHSTLSFGRNPDKTCLSRSPIKIFVSQGPYPPTPPPYGRYSQYCFSHHPNSHRFFSLHSNTNLVTISLYNRECLCRVKSWRHMSLHHIFEMLTNEHATYPIPSKPQGFVLDMFCRCFWKTYGKLDENYVNHPFKRFETITFCNRLHDVFRRHPLPIWNVS